MQRKKEKLLVSVRRSGGDPWEDVEFAGKATAAALLVVREGKEEWVSKLDVRTMSWDEAMYWLDYWERPAGVF